ncbi:2-phosphosulfolactate phosphatase [Desulfohalotomaculum tongense]|nr:2-phosphosulfolactate phosphatase [Desulforadius tongensis]
MEEMFNNPLKLLYNISMKLTVLPEKTGLKKLKTSYTAAVVLDILRATTTITTALENGCRGVIPVSGVDEARQLAGSNPNLLLGGERSAVKVPGFHLGNSPLEYSAGTVRGKVVVLTTTNGTGAIKLAAQKAGTVLIGCLLNARAVAEKLLNFNGQILLLCAGTGGNFSLEDTLAAGWIIKEFLALKNIDQYSGTAAAELHRQADDVYNGVIMDDMAVACYRLALYYNNKTLDALYDSLHGQKLAQLNMYRDLIYCSKLNTSSIVPIYRDGIITI